MTDSNQYRRAGVNIDAGNALIRQILPRMQGAAAVLSAKGAALLPGAGGFAAAVRMPQLKAPVLLACADGVGTKVDLLAKNNLPQVAGQDVVAMCVNDLICAGAQPLFFLDYYACGTLSPDFAAQAVEGILQGCEAAGCALIGGETAEMPGVYEKDAFDLAGFAVGIAEETMLLPHGVQPGDVLLSIASSGVHSNGYSLVRRILQTETPEKPIMDTLLSPTRIYCRSIATLRECCELHGLAHITGGGLPENLPRMLPDNCSARIKMRPLPPVFLWLQRAGGIDDEEMRRVFNCGVGMVVAVAAADAEVALASLRQSGEDAWVSGEVTQEESSSRAIIIE